MVHDAGASPTTGLPVRLTSFVGRRTELRRLAEDLGWQRLVTLVGPGGSGKTRLALEAASSWSEGPGYFVDLAPIDAADVPGSLAVATAAPEAPGEDPVSATARRLGDRPALLLVDNCDQVVDACARAIDQLLRSCPRLTVLATSREPLRVEGEHLWRVPGLSLSEGTEVSDAVRLLLERCPRAADADRTTLDEICRHLDGMPLAIELAAARAAVLPLDDVLAGLGQRFRLLTGGPRTAESRQQSLAESIRWSHRLLNDDERTALHRLAVFRGPFTAEAATAVVAGDDVDADEALGLLADLVSKSFVTSDARRYRLLETIREYASGQLEEQPTEARTVRDRHLHYLRERAERIEPLFEGPELVSWTEQLELELPDIRAAVGWAATTGNADDALRLLGALWRFWFFRARGDGRELVESALAIPGGEDRWRAKALTAATLAALTRFDLDLVSIAEEAVRVAEAGGDDAVSARANCWLGWTCALTDAQTRAGHHLERACELARAVGDNWCLADALNAMVVIAPDPPTARRHGEAALDLATRNENWITACHTRGQLATVDLMQGRLDAATAHATAAMDTADLFGDSTFSAFMRYLLTWLSSLRGERPTVGHAEAAIELAEASGNPLIHGFAYAARGLDRYAVGDIADARADLEESLPGMCLLAGGLLAPQVIGVLVAADLAAGDAAAARAHATQAVDLAHRLGQAWARSRALLASARVSEYDGEGQAALQAAHGALELSRVNEDDLTGVDALETVARLEAGRGGHEVAARLLGAALASRERIGYVLAGAEHAVHDGLLGELGRQVGADRLADLLAQGGALPMSDAVDLAQRRRGSRRRPATGWEALTPAERRVAELVGEGLTNPQIAAQLFVSGNTVKGHVSQALAKLALTSRTELATFIARRS